MDTAEAINVRPQPGRIYGLTHDPGTGQSIIRAPRTLKVSIGLPPGKDVECVKDPGDPTSILIGHRKTKDGEMNWAKYNVSDVRGIIGGLKKANADAWHRNYPKKLEYFTFVQPGPEGTVEYDVESIIANPARPKEIDVVFIDENPLNQQMEMWTAAELKCYGDGFNAMRVHSLARTEEEKLISAAVKESDPFAKYFPLVNGCHQCGCPFSRPSMRGDKEQPAACKPHSKLKFQMMSSLRLGTTVEFDTTSWKTGTNLHSCLEIFRSATGDYVRGIPLKMILRPFRTSHNGQKAIAYTIALEFRAETAAALRTKLLEHASLFRRAESMPALQPARQHQIAAPAEPTDVPTAEGAPEEEDFEVRASTLNAEFYDGQDDADIEAVSPEPTEPTVPRGNRDEPTPAQIEVRDRKIEELKNAGQTPPVDFSNIEPDPPSGDEPPDLSNFIEHNQLLDLLTFASDMRKMSEKDVQNWAVGFGVKNINRIPKDVFPVMMADLQKSKEVRKEETKGKKWEL